MSFKFYAIICSPTTGSFRSVVIKTLALRSHAERKLTTTKFRELYNADLGAELKRISNKSLHPLIDELTCDRVESDVDWLHHLLMVSGMFFLLLLTFYFLTNIDHRSRK